MGVHPIEPVTDEQLPIEAAKRDPARFAELYDNNFVAVRRDKVGDGRMALSR